jgi:hypothetical protein
MNPDTLGTNRYKLGTCRNTLRLNPYKLSMNPSTVRRNRHRRGTTRNTLAMSPRSFSAYSTTVGAVDDSGSTPTAPPLGC